MEMQVMPASTSLLYSLHSSSGLTAGVRGVPSG